MEGIWRADMGKRRSDVVKAVGHILRAATPSGSLTR